MKTKSVLLLCALTTFGAFAQKSVVDEVDNILDKMSPDYKSAAEKIVPALTNDETKSDAKLGSLVVRLISAFMIRRW